MAHLRVFFPFLSSLFHTGARLIGELSGELYFPILTSLMLFAPWTGDERGGEEAKMVILHETPKLQICTRVRASPTYLHVLRSIITQNTLLRPV